MRVLLRVGDSTLDARVSDVLQRMDGQEVVVPVDPGLRLPKPQPGPCGDIQERTPVLVRPTIELGIRQYQLLGTHA